VPDFHKLKSNGTSLEAAQTSPMKLRKFHPQPIERTCLFSTVVPTQHMDDSRCISQAAVLLPLDQCTAQHSTGLNLNLTATLVQQRRCHCRSASLHAQTATAGAAAQPSDGSAFAVACRATKRRTSPAAALPQRTYHHSGGSHWSTNVPQRLSMATRPTGFACSCKLIAGWLS
jgi:hypothetical protein